MDVEIKVGNLRFVARLESEAAPKTCHAFQNMLPLDAQLIQARWSGEAAWIPFGDLDVGFGPEDPTCYPAPGQLLFYPGGMSETEILFPYGHAAFASKAGALAGNHFATVTEGLERIGELGRKVLWEGAQPIRFEER